MVAKILYILVFAVPIGFCIYSGAVSKDKRLVIVGLLFAFGQIGSHINPLVRQAFEIELWVDPLISGAMWLVLLGQIGRSPEEIASGMPPPRWLLIIFGIETALLVGFSVEGLTALLGYPVEWSIWRARAIALLFATEIIVAVTVASRRLRARKLEPNPPKTSVKPKTA